MNEETLRHVLDKPALSAKGIGLRNTDRRLKQLFGKGLRIQSAPNEGTTVAFEIPF